MDDTVAIDYFHRGQHCSALGVFFCCVFGKKLQLAALPLLPKAVGSDCQTKPKTHLKSDTSVDHGAKQDPVVHGCHRSWVWLGS
jgi:hypothetical protein